MAARPKNLFWYRFCGGKETVSRGVRHQLHKHCLRRERRMCWEKRAVSEQLSEGDLKYSIEHLAWASRGEGKNKNASSPRGRAFPCSAGVCLSSLPLARGY